MYASIRTHKTSCSKSMLLLLVVVCAHEWDEFAYYCASLGDTPQQPKFEAHSITRIEWAFFIP